MNTVCATGPTCNGIDVSHWQGIINWGSVRSTGAMFAFIKCTEGTLGTDKMFKDNWAHAKMVGILRGAYHYFHPGIDPIKQAANFVHAMGPLDAQDLPPVIDWETADKTSPKFDMAAAKKFVDEVERLTGRIPIIYGGPSFMKDLGLDHAFARYPLWVANYGRKCPSVPPPWTSWVFWQYASDVHVAGVNGRCDGNHFNGTGDQLKAFIAASVSPTHAVVQEDAKASAKPKKV